MENKSIPPFTEQYHKSRNALLIVSGILLAWELVGIKIEGAESSGVRITIQETDAIPYLLFILIIFFSFRVIVEWHQSDKERRLLKQSKIDLYVTMIIPIFAGIVHTIQKWVDVSVFKKIDSETYIIIAVVLFPMIFYFVRVIISKLLKLKRKN